MDIMDVIRERHSVRQYTDRPIEKEKRGALNALASLINRKAGLHIQVLFDEPKCFHSLAAQYGKFSGVRNYIALVGPRSEKLNETLGYYGEQMVLEAQKLGLNTCWVAVTHGRSLAEVGRNEKQACLIALGYGCTNGAERKSKSMEEVCSCSGEMPDWFQKGVEAALLAPTAMNQQRFHLDLLPDGTVNLDPGRGFFSNLDAGIVKYHFETVTGKTIKGSE